MKKIAVFGKPGSGKSTLSKNLASISGIPLHPLDSIVYKNNGDLVTEKPTIENMERYSLQIAGLLMVLDLLIHSTCDLKRQIH